MWMLRGGVWIEKGLKCVECNGKDLGGGEGGL